MPRCLAWLAWLCLGCEALGCARERLAAYRLELETDWGEDNFPKQFPLWRPPAQWSKTTGLSHAANTRLFSLGAPASPGLRQFVETGQSQGLEAEVSNHAALDSFTLPPITRGRGNSSALIFLDGSHSKVSLLSKIVPSPDWFIGLDSVDLCEEGHFVDFLALKVRPLDGGTDNGFTFTSPNWPTEPQGTVFEIRNDYPAHPAGSFHYPHLQQLPAIATFKFSKEREYSLVAKHVGVNQTAAGKIAGNEAFDVEFIPVKKTKSHKLKSFRNSEQPSPGYYGSSGPENFLMKKYSSAYLSQANQIIPNAFSTKSKSALKKLKSTFQRLSRKKKKHSTMKNMNTEGVGSPSPSCGVSPWSSWSACSQSCGIGETLRTRSRKGAGQPGQACHQPLSQLKWCGSARNCKEGYFDW